MYFLDIIAIRHINFITTLLHFPLKPLNRAIDKTPCPCTVVKTMNENMSEISKIFIPNRAFLVLFGGISGEFGRAMVRILARRSRAKIPMVRPNELDILPNRTKKGAIRYLPYPNSS